MKIVSLLLLAAPAVAHAEPTSYVQGGVLFGAASPVIGWNIMPSIDGGYRMTDMLWLHAGAGYGHTVDNLGAHQANDGSNSLVRAGVEARWCSSPNGVLCAAAGLDLGASHGTWSDPNGTYSVQYGRVDSISSTAVLAIPRAGFDIGGENLRARIGLEADLALAAHATSELAGAQMTESLGGFTGIELAAGVAYAW